MSTNNAAHTPGPWDTHDDGEGRTFIIGENGVRIARVLGQQGNPLHEANAELLSAPHQLLDALRREQEWQQRDKDGAIDPEWDYETMVGQYRRAAILRATGGAA